VSAAAAVHRCLRRDTRSVIVFNESILSGAGCGSVGPSGEASTWRRSADLGAFGAQQRRLSSRSVADGGAPVQVRERTRAGTVAVVLVAALVVVLVALSLCNKRWTSGAQPPTGVDVTVSLIG